MIFLLYIVLFFTVALLTLLFNPFYLKIDSEARIVSVGFKRLLIGDATFYNNQLIFSIKLLFFKIRIKANGFKRKRIKQINSTAVKSRGNYLNPQLFMALLKAWEIKRLHANIDTGNFVINATAYSVLPFFNYNQVDLTTNFENKNELYFEAQTRLMKLLFCFLRYRIKNQ